MSLSRSTRSTDLISLLVVHEADVARRAEDAFPDTLPFAASNGGLKSNSVERLQALSKAAHFCALIWPLHLMAHLTLVFSATVLCLSGAATPAPFTNGIPAWLGDAVRGGMVPEAACDLDAVYEANSVELHDLLTELSEQTFFRLFKVELNGECPFHKGDEVDTEESVKCTAGVEEPFGGETSTLFGTSVAPSKTPPPRTQCSIAADSSADNFAWSATPTTSTVDLTLSARENAALEHSGALDDLGCEDENLPQFWTNLCRNIPTNSSEDFVNLQLNPERWTGYNGSKVWDAIYEENCFANSELSDMCYEERVMYRLLSGMHTSINTHISLNYFPPSAKKGRINWEPNPERFMRQHVAHPDRLKNLHFAFVVLLRSLRKAAPSLYHYNYAMDESTEEDKRTQILVRRLLDTHVLKKCSSVFEAFDESMLFSSRPGQLDSRTKLKREFKDVFHNISSVLNCVTCQKCKLHGKMQLLGIGTALKILLLPPDLASSIGREEVVALVNTIAKFSQSIAAVPRLIEMYWSKHAVDQRNLNHGKNSDVGTLGGAAAAAPMAAKPAVKASTKEADNSVQPKTSLSQLHTTAESADYRLAKSVELDLMDAAVGAVAASASGGLLTPQQEERLIELVLGHHSPELLLLAKHYSADSKSALRFAQLALLVMDRVDAASSRTALSRLSNNKPSAVNKKEGLPVVVVGGGLAGLTAVLTMLDRGVAHVVLVEKEGFLGGNSAKASSGINGIDKGSPNRGDSVEDFQRDMVKGSQGLGKDVNESFTGIASSSSHRLQMVQTMVKGSGPALDWVSSQSLTVATIRV